MICIIRSRTQIDLFFTSRPELYISGVKQVDFSDHSAIFGIRKLHRSKLPLPRIIEAQNYRAFDSNLFKSDLEHVPWEILEHDTGFPLRIYSCPLPTLMSQW